MAVIPIGVGEEVERKLVQAIVYVRLVLSKLKEGHNSRLERPLVVSIAAKSWLN